MAESRVKSQESRVEGIRNTMKTTIDKRLLWYLKDEARFDLENPSHMDMYVQQVLSCGRAEDVKKMIKMLSLERFKKSFGRIKNFLPKEVKGFWEKGLGDIGEDSKRDTQYP